MLGVFFFGSSVNHQHILPHVLSAEIILYRRLCSIASITDSTKENVFPLFGKFSLRVRHCAGLIFCSRFQGEPKNAL